MVLDIRFVFSDHEPEPGDIPETPLPDEVLTCCGATWPTHAAWLAHYRSVHVIEGEDAAGEEGGLDASET